MINLRKPLDLDDPEAGQFLSNLQGNIIKGHGRNHVRILILQMSGEAQSVRCWLREFANSHVTSAANAQLAAKAWKATRAPTSAFVSLLLSADGYRYIGYKDDEIPKAGDNFKSAFHDKYFLEGMKNQKAIQERNYEDPPSSAWESSYQNSIHAMVLLADDDATQLSSLQDTIVASMNDIFEILCVEEGNKLEAEFSDGKKVIEHFGFQDGISQPLVIQQSIDEEAARIGNKEWSSAAPLSLVLTQEPGENGGFGSFMVYRKLEQNVSSFDAAICNLAKSAGVTKDLAGAWATGRYKDGTPLLDVAQGSQNESGNDFLFDRDSEGKICPFQSHIRKTNPRGDIARIIGAPNEFERARRIARRGITYGSRKDISNRSELPKNGVGLLFMCFQSNLDQFVIQQEGSDSTAFVKNDVGVDAIIGRNRNGHVQVWLDNANTKFAMSNFVRMLGGEYFFAPSFTFFANL